MKNESIPVKEPRYAREKPAECSKCFFWNERKRRCTLGGLSDCYFLLEAPPKKPDPCDSCNIGRARPCVGYCSRQLIIRGTEGAGTAGGNREERNPEADRGIFSHGKMKNADITGKTGIAGKEDTCNGQKESER